MKLLTRASETVGGICQSVRRTRTIHLSMHRAPSHSALSPPDCLHTRYAAYHTRVCAHNRAGAPECVVSRPLLLRPPSLAGYGGATVPTRIVRHAGQHRPREHHGRVNRAEIQMTRLGWSKGAASRYTRRAALRV